MLHRDGITQAASDPILAHEERGTREGARFGAVLGAVGGASDWRCWRRHSSSSGRVRACGRGRRRRGRRDRRVLGTIVGSAYGDTHFQRLASRLQTDQMLMSVNVAGRERTNEIEEIRRRHGADDAEDCLLRPPYTPRSPRPTYL